MTQTPFFSHRFVRNDYLHKSEKPLETIVSQPYEITKNLLTDLQALFQTKDLETCILSTVEFLNQYDTENMELSKLFHQWPKNDQESAFKWFSDSQLVQCINAIFFYKLYPDKLFNALIHPEKLVSVRMRLVVLHHFIEVLQVQLTNFAILHGLKPCLDYLFHGDDLPQGIMIEVNEQHRLLIQTAITQLKIKYTPETEANVALERMHDLARAYKFWFNPNRLIDASMVLQQRLVKNKIHQENDHKLFKQKMIELYGQLKTTECLNLYGYFSNKDSRYLLNTLHSIIEGKIPEWLHTLNTDEKNAIVSVFQSLQCVMEALRLELKNRQVSTQPYPADLTTHTRAGKRNREAVYRIIAIYGGATVITNGSVEKLFELMEGKNIT